MKKLTLTLLLTTLSTTAHAVPVGCFMTDTSSYCYPLSFSASDCDQWNMTSYYFGNYISSMCGYVNTLETVAITSASSLDKCNSDFGVVVGQRDTCVALAANIEKNRQEWVTYARGRDAVIKKLQRACGSKCRRIK
jgi:hypothetical protein